MTKINETRNLENGHGITIKKEGGAYMVCIDEEAFFTASLLECRAYAEARLDGKGHGEATEAARQALERKNSRPTEAHRAHELGMTIREYRAHRQAIRAEDATATDRAIESARKGGLDLSLGMMEHSIRIENGELVIEADSRTRAEKEAELRLWARLWDQGGVLVRRTA